jgi:cytochrome c-type biogenesis protein CcmH/NrfG
MFSFPSYLRGYFLVKEMDKSNRFIENTTSLVILWGLLVIVFFRPLLSGITWPWSNTYAQILILFLLAVRLLSMTIKGELVFRRTVLDIPIFLFLLALIISLFKSVNSNVSFNQIYQFFSYPALYFLIVNSLEDKLTRRQGTALIFALALTVAFSLTAWLGGMGISLSPTLFPLLAVIAVGILFRRSLSRATGEDINTHALILYLMLGVVILVSLYGIYQHYWGLEQTRRMVQIHKTGQFSANFLSRLDTNKVFSTFVFPPALAGYLILLLPLALALFISLRGGWRKLFPGLTLILGGLGLFFTYSKGGWVGFLLSLALLVFIILGRKHRFLFFVSFFILIGLFLVLIFSGILPSVKFRGFVGSLQVRIDYWRAGLGMLRDYLPFGSGLGTFGTLYAKYQLAGAGETQMAHNNYLQVWIETGILGIISFLWLWVAFLKAGWRIIKDKLKDKCSGAPVLQCSGQKKKVPINSSYTPMSTGGLRKGMVIGCYVGVVAFLIQSLVDFDLYVQGIATYVWLFMGMVMISKSSYKLYPDTLIPLHPHGHRRAQAGTSGHRRVISYKLTNTFFRIVVATVIVAVTAFLMVTVRKPMVAERYFRQSAVYLNRGLGEEAIASLNEAIRINPGKADYYYRLGSIYQSEGSLDEAISQYRKAVERDSFMPHYHSALGKALWDRAKGKDKRLMDEAVRQFEKARDSYPTKAEYRVLLGRIYELTGRRKEAVRQYAKALELDPSLEKVRAEIEKIQGRQGSK